MMAQEPAASGNEDSTEGFLRLGGNWCHILKRKAEKNDSVDGGMYIELIRKSS